MADINQTGLSNLSSGSGSTRNSTSGSQNPTDQSSSAASSNSVEQMEKELQRIKPPTGNIYSPQDIERQKKLMARLAKTQEDITKSLIENEKNAVEYAKQKAEFDKEKANILKKEELAKQVAIGILEEQKEKIKGLEKNDEEKKELIKKAEEKHKEYIETLEQKTKKDMEVEKKAIEDIEKQISEVQKKIDTEKEEQKKAEQVFSEGTAILNKATEERTKKLNELAGKRVGFFSILAKGDKKVLDAFAAEDEGAKRKKGFEAVLNENLRRALIAQGNTPEEKERYNEIIKKSISKMYYLEDATEEEFIKSMTEQGGTAEEAKSLYKLKEFEVKKKGILGDATRGFGGLKEGTLGKVVGAQSGAEVGSALKDTVSMFLGPMGKLVLDAVSAIFNRMNQIGKEGKELYEKTGGRYGYGQGFDLAQARGFSQFSGAARNMAYTYAKSAEEVKSVFKEMSEYVGVKSFDQMKALAESTMQVANATGLATAEVAKLGGSYQKFFGMDAQKAAMTSGRQLLGLMTEINKGMTANLMLSNQQIANLMMKMVEAGEGADVSKTLIPFIGTAQEQLKGLGIQSAYVRDKLAESMMNLKATGAGLPKSMAMFMLGTGNLFQKNRMNAEEQQIAGTKGQFSYEKARVMATKTTGSAQKFWSSDRLTDETLATVAFALKGGNVPSLLASLGDEELGNISKLVFQLYQIEGAEEALGISLTQVTDQFAKIAREDKLKYKLMGGDMGSLTAMSQFAEAQRMVKTGKKADGSMATKEELDKAAASMTTYAKTMTPQDRTNQFLEKIVGSVDTIIGLMMKIIPGTGELEAQRMGNLSKDEYNRMLILQQNMNRDEAQSKQLQELQSKQFRTTGISKTTVSNTTGDMTQKIEHKGSGSATEQALAGHLINLNPI